MNETLPAFRLRRATVADVPRVAPLFDAYRIFYGRTSDLDAAGAFMRERLERDESIVLVATNESEDVVGFAQLYRTFSSVSLGRVVVLNDLYVLPAWRRAGVGRALVESAAEAARESGAIRLDLSTQRTNASAQRLYHALGFVADTEFLHLSLRVASGSARA